MKLLREKIRCLRERAFFWIVGIASLLGSALLVAAQQADRQAVRFDFKQPGLSNQWSAQGKVQVRRTKVSEVSEMPGKGASGFCVQIDATAPGNFGTLRGQVPRDWQPLEELSFWVYRSKDETKRAPSTPIEVQLIESDGKTRFWRRVDLAGSGWQEIKLPLRWFRWADGRVPQWDKIERFQFWFREETHLSIDSISAQDASPDLSADLTAEDVRQVALQDTKPDEIKAVHTRDCILLTNANGLDAEKLTDHLAEVAAAVRRELPFLPNPRTPPFMVVFDTREQYRAFFQRLAKQFGGSVAAPTTDGITSHGIATSYWDVEQGTLRPVYSHEFTHAILSGSALIPDDAGDWVQEGLAAYFQARIHLQVEIRQAVRGGVRDASRRMPLQELTSGKRIPLNRYWQAASLWEMFLGTQKYRERLPKLFESFQANRTTDLGPIIESVLQTSWEDLERDWLDFCRRTYGA